MNGGDGVILSKRGDICVGWEMQLPPAFRCNEERYDSIIQTLSAAIQLLPDWAVVHKQDVYMRKRYYRRPITSGFLEEAYERHFDGREYLDHRCYLWVCFSSKKNIHGGTSGLLGLPSVPMPKAADISRFLTAAEQFASVLGGNSLLGLRRLTESDIFGTPDQVGGDGTAGHDGARPGIIQDYLNFTDDGADVLEDIQMAPDRVRIGGRDVFCHLFSDLEQLPGEVSSCRRIRELSTENSTVALSTLGGVGQELDCEHVVNTFIVKEPLRDIHAELDNKRRPMQSMSMRNAENRKFSEELGAYLETAAVEQMMTMRFHINVLSTEPDMTTTAISKLGITPVRATSNAPMQFWSAIPGNESGLADNELMTQELMVALCLGIYDGFDSGIPDGVLKMSDRLRLVPQRFDIQEKAMEHNLIENYNVFLLGPSGSGKSFFMNKYLASCYAAGQHCFLIDVGDSYRALCHIIKEESGGHDGTYYTFEVGKPISFNPFRNFKRFSKNDSEAMNFLFTLMVTLWKNGSEEISSSASKYVRESIDSFLRGWNDIKAPSSMIITSMSATCSAACWRPMEPEKSTSISRIT